MDVNYILIKGNKHFKCHSLAEMAIYFSLSVTSNGSVICDGYQIQCLILKSGATKILLPISYATE